MAAAVPPLFGGRGGRGAPGPAPRRAAGLAHCAAIALLLEVHGSRAAEREAWSGRGCVEGRGARLGVPAGAVMKGAFLCGSEAASLKSRRRRDRGFPEPRFN